VWTLTPASPGQVAGGDLTGTYPNPTVAAGVITWAKLSGLVSGKVYRSTAQSIPNGAGTFITFDTVPAASPSSVWNAGTPDRLIAPAAGFYLCGGSLDWIFAAGGSTRILSLVVNGSFVVAQAGIPAGAGGPSLCVSHGLQMSANDYVGLKVYQDSGAALNVTPSASSPTLWLARVA
jgi:hypothetical protein